jgi:hypothetical protein
VRNALTESVLTVDVCLQNRGDADAGNEEGQQGEPDHACNIRQEYGYR